MNQATATNRSATCDDCGARNGRIARVYKGIRYCPTCYKRMFKRRMCTGCGNFARLPIRIPEAVCRTCERRKPCVRCGRISDSIGKLTPYGPACKPCAPYFREPRAVRGVRRAVNPPVTESVAGPRPPGLRAMCPQRPQDLRGVPASSPSERNLPTDASSVPCAWRREKSLARSAAS